MAYAVRDNVQQHRFEIEAEGKIAFTAYALRDGAIELLHTEVPKELEGKGIGSALAQQSLEQAKARGLAAIVKCPFIRKWQERHPG
jgi:predicted GNAT family acetyltransferase